jgi:hypothetical protein
MRINKGRGEMKEAEGGPEREDEKKAGATTRRRRPVGADGALDLSNLDGMPLS